ncbi:MAG: PspC domain-containing protein [Chitinophagales bacterium]|nr:PspC domain-containing protein [Chitinophagales bacterium]
MKYEKKILGVCAWLAEKFEFDVSGIRILFIITTLLGGSGILAYLILYLIMPRK